MEASELQFRQATSARSSSAVGILLDSNSKLVIIVASVGYSRTPATEHNNAINIVMPARISLIGKRFGRLKVIRDDGYRVRGGKKRRASKCLCSCGNFVRVSNESISSGETKSCGCLAREMRAIGNPTHGMTGTRTYRIWTNMLTRCRNTETPSYLKYGKRGIGICSKWLKFENFLADMGECPSAMTIDRFPDKNGNYEKTNCRWATYKQQARNTRANRIVTFGGFTGCLIEVCEHFDLNYTAILARLNQLGWPVQKALSTPIKPKARLSR